MLLRLWKEKPPRGNWDVKLMQGGARDIEFIAQSLFLARRSDYAGRELTSTVSMLGRALDLTQISQADYDTLIRANLHFAGLTQYLALTHGDMSGEVDELILKHIAKLMMLKSSDDLRRVTNGHMQKVRRILPRFIAV